MRCHEDLACQQVGSTGNLRLARQNQRYAFPFEESRSTYWLRCEGLATVKHRIADDPIPRGQAYTNRTEPSLIAGRKEKRWVAPSVNVWNVL